MTPRYGKQESEGFEPRIGKELLANRQDGEELVAFYEGYGARSGKGGFPKAVYVEHLEKLNSAFRALDQRLEDGRPFLTGPDMTMADVLWAMKTMRLSECGYPFESSLPAYRTWYKRIESRPAFQEGVMGKHRLMNRAFRMKARFEDLLGVGLKREVLRRMA